MTDRSQGFSVRASGGSTHRRSLCGTEHQHVWPGARGVRTRLHRVVLANGKVRRRPRGGVGTVFVLLEGVGGIVCASFEYFVEE